MMVYVWTVKTLRYDDDMLSTNHVLTLESSYFCAAVIWSQKY